MCYRSNNFKNKKIKLSLNNAKIKKKDYKNLSLIESAKLCLKFYNYNSSNKIKY